jgi:hypothetical protein
LSEIVAAGIDGAERSRKHADTIMHRPDEEDEEDLRTYASVFERLTSGSLPSTPPRHQKLLAEGRQRASAIGERVRDDLVRLGTQLREGPVAFARRVRERIGDRPRWSLARASGRQITALHREPSLFVGLASFAFAFSVAWWTGGPSDRPHDRRAAFVGEQPVAALTAPLPATDTAPQPAAWDVGEVFRTPGASEATQLAVVDELSKKDGDDATKALLAGVDSESMYVSMASLRALAGRPCGAIASQLARRLDDAAWQRRAWAARILGANDCAGAALHLTQRLAVEPDLRVQTQIQLAIDSLKEPGA